MNRASTAPARCRPRTCHIPRRLLVPLRLARPQCASITRPCPGCIPRRARVRHAWQRQSRAAIARARSMTKSCGVTRAHVEHLLDQIGCVGTTQHPCLPAYDRFRTVSPTIGRTEPPAPRRTKCQQRVNAHRESFKSDLQGKGQRPGSDTSDGYSPVTSPQSLPSVPSLRHELLYSRPQFGVSDVEVAPGVDARLVTCA